MNYNKTINGAIFANKAEIDSFIKATNISTMQKINAMMLNAHDAATKAAHCAAAMNIAHYLHDRFGMSWAEIEAVEFAD